MKNISHLLLLLSALCFFSCDRNKNTKDFSEAKKLFSESSSLISDYTSLINNASDSVTVDSLAEVFEKKITDLNFSVSPQTDMLLTEQENDSLIKLLDKYQEAKKNRLRELSSTKSAADTISEKDS